MQSEKMQILQMLQQGKLSTEEALKLLEAVETEPAKSESPKASHLRIKVMEGGKARNFSVGIGLVHWVSNFLSTSSVKVMHQPIDKDAILSAIDAGKTGKIFEAADDGQKVEIWLDP